VSDKAEAKRKLREAEERIKEELKEVEERVKREAKEAKEKAKGKLREATERAEREAEEAKKAREAEARAKKEAEWTAKEKAKREAEEAKERAKREAKEAKKAGQAETKAKRQVEERAKKEAEEEVGAELYEGMVKLTIASPVDYEQIRKLEEYLRQVQNLHLISVGGSSEEGTKIVVSAEEPIPLANVLREMPAIEQVVRKGKEIQVTLKARF